jgi:hypothetical protein
MQVTAVGLGAAFGPLPEHDPAQQARAALLPNLCRVSGTTIVRPRLGSEHRMDDDNLHRVRAASAVLLLSCCAPRRRRSSSTDLAFVFLGQHLWRGRGGTGRCGGLGEDARERLRLVVGLSRSRPGNAGAVWRT